MLKSNEKKATLNLFNNKMIFEDGTEYYLSYKVLSEKICESCANKACKRCDNAIAEHIIVDLRENKPFKTIDEFEIFQTNNIAKFCYDAMSDIRYNIYVLFIIDSYNSFDKPLLEDIEKNMDYARKRFFTIHDLEAYLTNDFICSNNNMNEKGYSAVVEQWMNTIESNHLFDSITHEETNQLLSNKKGNVKQDYKYLDNITSVFNVVLHKFRGLNFSEGFTATMKKANIIWGENGYGKSSILEAIEFGITGDMHKSTVDEEVVKVKFDNDSEISSSDDERKRKSLYQKWYGNANENDEFNEVLYDKVKFNEKFCTYNYLDYDILQKYILNYYRNKDFSEEYILSIINIPSVLQINRKVNRAKGRAENIINEYNKYLRLIKKPRTLKPRSVFVKGLIDSKLIQNINSLINENTDMNKLCDIAEVLLMVIKNADANFKPEDSVFSTMKEVKVKIEEKYKILTDLPSLTQSGLEEIQLNIDKIDAIFRKIYSYSECRRVCCENDELYIENNDGGKVFVNELNKSQLISLAISIIIALRLNLKNSPKFIMFDEIAANFDSRRKLNFIDFLREMCLNDWQVFFTTADKNEAALCRRKFSCFGKELNFMQLQKGENNRCNVIQKKYSYKYD